MSQESIIDTTKPNAGRMYDYYLGGHHNFEVDRQAAEQVSKLLPFIPKGARLQRWCLQDIATDLTQKRGFDVVIDFASGLPTNDHIHYVVPQNTTVIYSDRDPVVVEYAQQILKDTPNVHFFQADIRLPQELLGRREVQDILGDKRDVALIMWGVAALLADEDVSHAVRYLYEWSGPHSCLAFNAQMANADPTNPALAQALKIYEQMGSTSYIRSLVKYEQMIQPWQPDENGFVSLLDWHGFDQTEMSKEDRSAFGPGGAGYGAYLVK
jgi:hypothetical protein